MSFRILFFTLLFLSTTVRAQISISPEFPTQDTPITITYDASLGTSGLEGASSVMMHSGVVIASESSTTWEYVVGDWGDPDSPGEMTSLGNDKWSITLTPSTYYAMGGLPENTTIYRIGMVFREAGPCGGFDGNSSNCLEGKSDSNTDFFIDISTENEISGKWNTPESFPFFADVNATIEFDYSTNKEADITLEINGVAQANVSAATQLVHSYTPTASGLYTVDIQFTVGPETIEETSTFIVRGTPPEATLPAGVTPGINYLSDQEVVLCLWAPLKSNVYVLGDFNEFIIDPDYAMNRDGEYFWISVSGLEPGKEYAYRYLVDETIYIADPYADKILDPSDAEIPASIYPDLKTFPTAAKREDDRDNRLSVLQTNQTPFEWNTADFDRPESKDLMVYELLVRDFFSWEDRSYQNLIDTLSYFENLGINAIELLPIMEFNGNNSWGYNTTFYFAPDKAYGTKNDLKAFIDAAHEKGIAVILDIVFNQNDTPSPLVWMYYDKENNKPSSNNPWFNPEAKHPFNVFFDMNHESTYTQKVVDDVLAYWLTEYQVDGFRFDLSKGFTQNATTDVGVWSSKDESRIALLKRIYDEIRSYDSDAYLILEHFAANEEETILANYGFLLWDNANHASAQNSMGFSEESGLEWYHFAQKGWNHPNNITYAESHDEERLVYKTRSFGNTASGYSTQVEQEALERTKATHLFELLIPGPKMLWQFEELGYDISIEENGRTGEKPVLWDYYYDENRKKIYDLFANITKLKREFAVFSSSNVIIDADNASKKQLTLFGEPYTDQPENSTQVNVVLVANFGVSLQDYTFTFPHTGNWWHYYNQNELLEVSQTETTLRLQPGEVRLYFDYAMAPPKAELLAHLTPQAPTALVATETLPNGISLTWENNSTVALGYKVYRSLDGDNFTLLADLDANTRQYIDKNGILPEQTYYYSLFAYNKYDQSSEIETQISTSNLITAVQPKLIASVYPNPTKGVLTIISEKRISKVLLFDLNGNAVVDAVEIQSRDSHHIEMEISKLQAGVYFLQLIGEGSTAIHKLIKTNE